MDEYESLSLSKWECKYHVVKSSESGLLSTSSLTPGGTVLAANANILPTRFTCRIARSKSMMAPSLQPTMFS
jgi:hypothetical protein